jgi:ubiquinone/menaquinone biosynthesis C-methylase UbiE
MSQPTTNVATHYGRADLGDRILAALASAGKDAEHPTIEDLAPVDHFHLRGHEATVELARLANLGAAASSRRVLDVGGGIGGPARALATLTGAHVTVLDLTEDYCRVGADLTARTGLSDRVEFRHGDACAMPFDDATFDVAWTQHSSMNVPDKTALYAEIHRVLRRDGRLALHEIMAGTGGPPHFPVPWSTDGTISFLESEEWMRQRIAETGFREILWESVTTISLDWIRERLSASGPPPPLGLQLLIGPAARTALENVARNLEEDRIRVVEAVFEKA